MLKINKYIIYFYKKIKSKSKKIIKVKIIKNKI